MLNLSKRISDKLSKELQLDRESNEVIAYGAFAFIQIIISILVVSIIGYFLNILVEVLIISFSVSILRKFSGGVHATSPNRCLLIGTFFCVIQGLVSKKLSLLMNIDMLLILCILSFTFTYCIVYKLAPVDSKNKSIKNLNKRASLKIKSINVITLYLVLFICGTYYRNSLPLSYSISLLSGTLWQVFTLTSIGKLLLINIDSFLNRLWRSIYEKV
ncbi:accessory gene regulator ArgB-like protein [Clostridium hydrogeniformans]|uniref:accessory gene regulator ArgB-like protein n=1 Tax=Clostridium hydrogeniformans TaxID=349933 RepID=UPI000488B9C8|nr:accessory gene regulator B family protein [Clostridium hydrogeniformans]